MLPRVAILLPTFNGEKYLAQQLDSLIAQSCRDLIVVIRDDASNDRTLNVIRSYQDKYPDIFHLVENGGHNLGAGASFSFLMNYVLHHKKELGLEKACMMFCDQDDIWDANKVEVEMQCMETAEAGNTGMPILVHSDLKVVSDSGKLMADSFMDYQGLEREKNQFGRILFCNTVTGCTALINESLAEQSLPVPEEAVMHDWWLALVASAFGRLVLVDQPLVEYRQHIANTYGAVKRNSARSFRQRITFDPELREQAAQANAFLRRYHNRLTMKQKAAIRFASLLSIRSGLIQRTCRRLGRGF